MIHQRSGFSVECSWIYLQFVIQTLYGSRLKKWGSGGDKNKERMRKLIVK